MVKLLPFSIAAVTVFDKKFLASLNKALP